MPLNQSETWNSALLRNPSDSAFLAATFSAAALQSIPKPIDLRAFAQNCEQYATAPRSHVQYPFWFGPNRLFNQDFAFRPRIKDIAVHIKFLLPECAMAYDLRHGHSLQSRFHCIFELRHLVAAKLQIFVDSKQRR